MFEDTNGGYRDVRLTTPFNGDDLSTLGDAEITRLRGRTIGFVSSITCSYAPLRRLKT